MSMTKAEKAEVAKLRRELAIARALRFTEFIKPDLPPPTGTEVVNGYLYNACQSFGIRVRVEKACSSSVHHNFGGWDKTTSQDSRSLYSTRLLAFKAGRSELARSCAESLADVDDAIEREELAEKDKVAANG